MSVVVVASFFLFGTFSFFVNNVDNLPTAFNWPFSPQKLYPFPDVQGNELLLYGVLGRPRTGLFRLGVGELAAGGLDRFEKSWSHLVIGCRESTAIVESRSPQAMCLARSGARLCGAGRFFERRLM